MASSAGVSGVSASWDASVGSCGASGASFGVSNVTSTILSSDMACRAFKWLIPLGVDLVYHPAKVSFTVFWNQDVAVFFGIPVLYAAFGDKSRDEHGRVHLVFREVEMFIRLVSHRGASYTRLFW